MTDSPKTAYLIALTVTQLVRDTLPPMYSFKLAPSPLLLDSEQAWAVSRFACHPTQP